MSETIIRIILSHLVSGITNGCVHMTIFSAFTTRVHHIETFYMNEKE